MTTAISASIEVFLRRAGLFAGMVAIIAGILGMHILSGSHDMTLSASGSAAGMLHTGHVMGDAGGQPQALVSHPDAALSPSASFCPAPAAFPSMSTMDQECIPAPGSTSFDVPLPGTTCRTHRVQIGTDHGAGRSYVSSSPSPGDLGISRT
ncbi:hypothetical protein [Arthrobacter sp. MMS24-S77]